jgi:hypothetical protein
MDGQTNVTTRYVTVRYTSHIKEKNKHNLNVTCIWTALSMNHENQEQERHLDFL